VSTITIQEAQATLPELIHKLAPGEEVLIIENDRPIAKLVAEREPIRHRQPGLGLLSIIADDEDHLTDFAEYMP
jgi:antitoxin (DNA-binding transcriptional repressor) of toxin-antitoxin stability system